MSCGLLRVASAALCAASVGVAMARPNGFVFVALESPSHLQLLDPLDPVQWSVTAQVFCEGRDEGLAGICLDIANTDYPTPQSAALPDLLSPSNVPIGMENFSRPLGLSNAPPPGSAVASGYGGTPGVSWIPSTPYPYPAPSLLEIGGIQNVFGVAGQGVGTNAECVASVGDGPQPQLVASGQFPAPRVPGLYEFQMLRLGVAVFARIGGPGEESTVQTAYRADYGDIGADTSLGLFANWAFRFTVRCRADFNHDGSVSVQDLFDFLIAYFGAAADADFDGDDDVDVNDLFVFLRLWFTGCEF